MLFKFLLITSFFVQSLTVLAQNNALKSFKKLSCPEKRWVVCHPFVAKKALKISQLARLKTDSILQNKLLKGVGNGDQVDAFRHTYWMASLTQTIGQRKAKRLGIAHEKGNKRDFKKGNKEEGSLPDKISTEMDLFNNAVGLKIGANTSENLIIKVVEEVKKGSCKIIKTDEQGNFLDCEGDIIPSESLKGKWENKKCLVWSNE
tara:strand:- start:396 stop:1007 length:612 start_codon:yes stop_codon:yes gene_type:complete